MVCGGLFEEACKHLDAEHCFDLAFFYHNNLM